MERAQRGNAPAIKPRHWAREVAESRSHALVKLIVHTLRVLVKNGETVAKVSDDELARLTSLNTKTVRKYRKEAELEGWFYFTSGNGRGEMSTYKISVPAATVNQIAARLDALTKGTTKGTQEMGTFNDQEPQKVPTTVIPFTSKVPTAGVPLESKGTHEGDTFQDDLKKVPPHPPKEINKLSHSELEDTQRESDGVTVNGSGIKIHFRGRRIVYDYPTIDQWAALAMCPQDTARAIVEAEARGWLADGKIPDTPARWMQRNIAKWRVQRQADDAQIRRQLGSDEGKLKGLPEKFRRDIEAKRGPS